MDKQLRYTELVAKRKECRLCESHDLTNPSACQNGAYDMSGHIGPWTQWQGNLDADLMGFSLLRIGVGWSISSNTRD